MAREYTVNGRVPTSVEEQLHVHRSLKVAGKLGEVGKQAWTIRDRY